MKTSQLARRLVKARLKAGVVAVLLLAAVVVWLAYRFGHNFSGGAGPKQEPAPPVGDWVTPR